MTTTLPILLGWRAEDCWSLWFVGIGGAALRLLQAGFCGMLCLPVTSGARICGPGAALKRLLSSRELLVLRPYSQPLKHPRVSLLISPAPGAWLSLGRQPHARLDPHAHFFKPPRFFPVFLLKKKKLVTASPAQRLCSPAQGRTLERGHGASLPAPLPTPGFPEALRGFRTAEE